MTRREDGNASLAVLGAVAIAMVVLLAVGDLAVFVVARAKAQTAADAASLAAAADLIPGTITSPAASADRYARLNGASLVSCDCRAGARAVEVVVNVPVRFIMLRSRPGVRARARAEVDLTG